MEVDQKKEPDSPKYEKGHSANSIHTKMSEEYFEEFVEVPSIMDADVNEENDEKKCRFCW